MLLRNLNESSLIMADEGLGDIMSKAISLNRQQ